MGKRVGRTFLLVMALVVSAALLAACTQPQGDMEQEHAGQESPASETPPASDLGGVEPSTDQETEGEAGSQAGTAETASASTPPTPALNPLTGEEVRDPAVLSVRPLLVSVSNFPVSARPQAGLSLAAQVWETFIGEGMTRFLAVFYGDYAANLQAILDNRLAEGSDDGYVIGPVRSGRVVFEDVKTLFEGALLITAGASPDVAAQLTSRVSVYGENDGNINSTGVDVDDLALVNDGAVDPASYASLTFDSSPPAGGTPGTSFRLVYNYYNQIGWTYDPASGAYLRFQDQADGSGELFPAVERLTGDQLAFDNVLVLWAQHRYVTPTIIEMQLVYVWDQRGLLFRDGQLYPVLWSTRSGEFRIYDEGGQPVPLNPGSTFVEVVSWETTWDPEEMVVRYHNPPQP